MNAFFRKLSENWTLNTSEKVNTGGETISSNGFMPEHWLQASVPSTVLAALLGNGVYQDLYTGTNMQKVDPARFREPWWYRTVFYLSAEESNKTILLLFEGINYKANIWLNGKLVADANTVKGTFRRFRFDISSRINRGENTMALEVFPPGPGDFSTGFVDWNIDPPDNNMGIFREVCLHFHGGIAIENPFVETKFNTSAPDVASLTISSELVNDSAKKLSGTLIAEIDSLKIGKPITIQPGERKEVIFLPEEFLELNILKPNLWWPNNLGKPSLYKLKLSFVLDGTVSDTNEVAFGIRKIEDYFNEQGHRGFIINGHKILIKGAAWTDDLLLMDTHESLESQIAYVKHLNLNCIRLEGFWGKDQRLYDLCDGHGILIMVGWSCHWEHEEYLGKPADPLYGGITEPEDIRLIAESWKDQLLWLRNHPSILVWNVGSDKIPHPDLERKYVKIFEQYDRTRPYLNSTGGVGSEQGVITDVELVSEISGSSGMKMLGPYAYTPPVYWYTDKHFGGAYGFNTETCPGANVPPLESIKRMIPAEHLWPVNEVWEFHCGKNNFKTLDRIITAITKRYGEPENVEDFAFKAQVLNYELMRPMFESFRINIPEATGIIQWMLNSAWPRMYWQLYDHYLMPNGAFYAVRKACAPLHLAYNYGNRTVWLINDLLCDITNHTIHIRLLDLNAGYLLDKVIPAGCRAESVSKVFTIPENPQSSTVWFLDLRLTDKTGNETDNNFYWLSSKPDVLDYDYEFDDWAFYTPSKEYADFSGLRNLEPVQLGIRYRTGQYGSRFTVHFEIINREPRLAFFTELGIKDKDTGLSVLPVLWSDNYFSLLPGESREVSVTLTEESLKGHKLTVTVDGWNIVRQTIEIKEND